MRMVIDADPEIGSFFRTGSLMTKFMIETKYARRLDSSGRLVIPIRLREELGLEIGETYTFYKQEIDGETYLCIKCGEDPVTKAKKLLAEKGYEITDTSAGR